MQQQALAEIVYIRRCATYNGDRAAFLAAATLSLIGAIMALRVPDADAAATMRRADKPIPATRREVAAALPEGD